MNAALLSDRERERVERMALKPLIWQGTKRANETKRTKRTNETNEQLTMEPILLFFLFFSLSRSKRLYFFLLYCTKKVRTARSSHIPCTHIGTNPSKLVISFNIFTLLYILININFCFVTINARYMFLRDRYAYVHNKL